MRHLLISVMVLVFCAGRAGGQAALPNEVVATNAATATNSPSPTSETEVEHPWAFSASVYTYLVPDSREYVQPTLTADYRALHLEARYNYENLDTCSLWVGYNFSVGEKLVLEFKPMVGGVLGNTTGIAPGYRFLLSYWKLELASEGEYVFNTRESTDSFFYNWSELSISPLDWLRVGVAIQRTKLYQSEFDIQRGFLAGFAYKKMSFTAYIFNPDASEPTLVLGVGLEF